jgi:membrane glycosyltransferase
VSLLASLAYGEGAVLPRIDKKSCLVHYLPAPLWLLPCGVVKIQVSQKALISLPGQRFCEPVSWHFAGWEVFNRETAFSVFLFQPHVLDVNMAQLSRDPLALFYN